MDKTIDCLFIGYNEIPFVEYEKTISKMGIESGAYRGLNLNYIQYDNRPYPASEIFNLFARDGESQTAFQPLTTGGTFSSAIAYLGTYLDRRGLIFDFINSFRDESAALSEKLEKENILTIAIITTFYVSAFPILEIVDFIKKHNRTAKIIIGGPFVATQVRSQEPAALEYLLKITIGADIYINSSQGEGTLVNVIQALKNNLSLDRVNNIYYRYGKELLSTPTAIENNKLSENMVNWDLFADFVGGYVNVRSAISCPFSCAFCGFPEQAGKHQFVSGEDIYRELSALDKIESVKFVNFIDDTFNIPQKRFKDLLDMINQSKFKFKWVSNLRCQSLRREEVRLMKESGCEGVFLGIESGNDQILKNMNKKASAAEYLEGIALLKEYDILTFGSFIIGFPGETYETAMDTLKFIEESGIDFYRVEAWYCWPFTPVWREREKYGLKNSLYEWRHSTMDWKTACDIVEEIFLKVEGPLWVPMHNFSFDCLWRLRMRGISYSRIRDFLRAFNRGMKQKLKDPSNKEINFEIISQLKEACIGKSDFEKGPGRSANVITRDSIKFNF